MKCLSCDAKSTLAKAFGQAAKGIMPQCRGRHPHLGLASEPCGEQLRSLVLGASNLWFNSSVSVLSLPVGGGSLGQLVYDHWAELRKGPCRSGGPDLRPDVKPSASAAFAGIEPDDIWDTRGLGKAGGGSVPDVDVRGPEWVALTTGSQGQTSPHFEAEPIDAPSEFVGKLAQRHPGTPTEGRYGAVWVYSHRRRRARRPGCDDFAFEQSRPTFLGAGRGEPG